MGIYNPRLISDDVLLALAHADEVEVDGFTVLYEGTLGDKYDVERLARALAHWCGPDPARVLRFLLASPRCQGYWQPKKIAAVAESAVNKAQGFIAKNGFHGHEVTSDPPAATVPPEAPVEDDGTPWNAEQSLPSSSSPYTLDSTGITVVRKVGTVVEQHRFFGQPILVVRRDQDIDDKTESVTLRWRDGSTWVERTVPRETISASRDIVKLSARGLAVTSESARDLVGYLSHILDRYQHVITRAVMVSTCGHKPIHDGVFVAGRTTYPLSAPQVALSDAVDSTFAAALGPPEGTPEETATRLRQWVAVAKELESYPVAAFIVASGFLASILTDIGMTQNPIIDLWGKGTSGKTTTMRFAASGWGIASERQGLIKAWGSTDFYFEKYAAMNCDLPIFMDESTKMSNAQEKQQMVSTIYRFANGGGRSRGGKDGLLQATSFYTGVLLSTGEDPLVEKAPNDGLTGRIVTFGPPVYAAHQDELITRINNTATDCYGVAGAAYLEAYMTRRDEFKTKGRAWYAAALERIGAAATDDLGRRLASCAAGVEAAAHLMNEILGVGWDVQTMIDAAVGRASGVRRADAATASLEALGAWAAGRRNNFEQPSGDAIPLSTTMVPNSYANPVLGRIFQEKVAFLDSDGEANPDDKEYTVERWAFAVDETHKVLTAAGYQPIAMATGWADNGWIETTTEEGKRRLGKRTRLRGTPTRLYTLTEAGMRVAFGDDGRDEAIRLKKERADARAEEVCVKEAAAASTRRWTEQEAEQTL